MEKEKEKEEEEKEEKEEKEKEEEEEEEEVMVWGHGGGGFCLEEQEEVRNSRGGAANQETGQCFAGATKCSWGECAKTVSAQRTVVADWRRCVRLRRVCLRCDCNESSSCHAIACQVNLRAGGCSLLCLHHVLDPMDAVGQSSGRTRAANAPAGMPLVMRCSRACWTGIQHATAGQRKRLRT